MRLIELAKPLTLTADETDDSGERRTVANSENADTANVDGIGNTVSPSASNRG